MTTARKPRIIRKIDWQSTLQAMSVDDIIEHKGFSEYLGASRSATYLKSNKKGVWSINKNIYNNAYFTITRIA